MKRTFRIELAVIAAVALVPFWGSPLTTFLATDAAIWALFAVSLNILVGYTGLVSFGHAAYFGIGGYAAGLLLKATGLPFLVAFPLAGVAAGLVAAVFGFFCVRLTKVYFSMLTLAVAQIAWAVCMKWNAVTGGDQGMSGIPYPDLLGLFDAVPVLAGLGTSDRYHVLVVALVGAGLVAVRRIMESPFGRVLTMIRENPSRAEFVGVNIRAYQLAAFVIAGVFAGLAGALFAIFNRGMYPDLMYWTKSAEVLIMVLLGGKARFHGPIVGAFVLLWLNQEVTAVTEYWSLIVGVTLIALLFFLPGGIVEAVERLRGWRPRRLPGAALTGATPRTEGRP
ncbi:MAG TPA: branched-chain amino acid ABC transporter permease [Azospirillum sp.]|nr:branched-chain amino acid ABC transporter permease [Azospirillum sp.]